MEQQTADGHGLELVHATIRGAIIDGSLQPGQVLSQVQLADQLGVSRTPLREALRMLQREGLVDAEPNRRVRVAGFSVDDMEELYTVRIGLEALAVRLTVPRLDSTDIAALEGKMAQMAHFAEEEEYERWEHVHQDFHAGLVAYGGRRLTTMLKQLSDHCERYRRLYTTQAPRAWSVGVVEHRAILDAYKAGDADTAAARLGEHLAHTVVGVIRLVDPDHELTALQTVLATLGVAPPKG